jgi:hypothetical protein
MRSFALIVEDIRCLESSFIRDTDKTPQRLYMGDEEWFVFRSDLEGKCLYNCDAKYTSYNGMRIFRVLANSHLNVA